MEASAVSPPDLEAHVYSLLSPLGRIKVWAFDSGSAWPHVAEVTSLQVDVRASSKARARARAYEARTLVLRLSSHPWDAGVVARVEVITGPLWEPDQDGAPRYVLRVSVTYRPAVFDR